MVRQPSRRHMLEMSLLTGAALAVPGLASAQGVEDAPGVAASRAVLRRLMGARADDVKLTLAVSAEGTRPWFEVAAKDGRAVVRGSSPSALTRGAYAYLKAAGIAQVSWEGDMVRLPRQLPSLTISRCETPFQHRAYFNPCTYGYTMPFWDWPRWQREIDWMALHGIDMPLALEGQEYVWRRLWSEMGLSEAELDGYFSGPAFTPWHRMGNIEGYQAPLPKAWIDKKRTLQTKILGRMRDLGMSPVLPAFAGYVPRAFAEKHPEAKITKMDPWGGFHDTWWLDPTDPLFAPIAKRFADLYTTTYGQGTYYLADSFNEMRPPVHVVDGGPTRSEQLATYGRQIYAAVCAGNPDAVWVIQGWMFSFQPDFWDAASVAAFLRDVPDGRMMVLDIANDSYPGVWNKTCGFGGKSWIFGYIHNFGGNNPLFGDLDAYRNELNDLGQRKDTGKLSGFGMFPEGLDTNSVVYEYAFDQAWKPDARPVSDWLADYLRVRYGATTPGLLDAWNDLHAAVYRTRVWTTSWWRGMFGTYLFFKRPNVSLVDFEGDPGDRVRLGQAVGKLLGQSGRFGAEPLFRYDLIAAVAHLVTLTIDHDMPGIIRAYQAGDPTAPQRWRRLRTLALLLDDLLGAQPDGLAQWIDQARTYATSPSEAAYYIENAKAQVTVWGGDNVLADYASKAWQGLYRAFYVPRWDLFFTELARSVADKKVFVQANVTADLAHWERDWVKANTVYKRKAPARPYPLIGHLLAKCDQT